MRKKFIFISFDGNGVYNFKYMFFLSEFVENGEFVVVDLIFLMLIDLVYMSVMIGVWLRDYGVVENGYYDRIVDRKVNFYEYEVVFNFYKVIKVFMIVDILRGKGVRVVLVLGYMMLFFSGIDVRIFLLFFVSNEMYRKYGWDWRKDVWVFNLVFYFYEECKLDFLFVYFVLIDGM